MPSYEAKPEADRKVPFQPCVVTSVGVALPWFHSTATTSSRLSSVSVMLWMRTCLLRIPRRSSMKTTSPRSAPTQRAADTLSLKVMRRLRLARTLSCAR